MALTSFATTPTFYRVGNTDDGFTGVHIFGTGFTYAPDGGIDVPITGTITSMRFILNGTALVAVRDLPVSDVALLAANIDAALAIGDVADPGAAFVAVLAAFEGASFVDLALQDFGADGDTNDVMVAKSTGSNLFGGLGDDELRGLGGNDQLFGDAGNDQIFGGDGNDFISSGTGNDTILAGDGRDTMFQLEGDNLVRAGTGDDTIIVEYFSPTSFGTFGDNTIFGGDGNDQITSSEGNDKLFGGNDDDFIYTGDGTDVARGGAGNDIISLGGGSNQAFGGAGEDTFVFQGTETVEGPVFDRVGDVSVIRDFDVADDFIWARGEDPRFYFGGVDGAAELRIFSADATQRGDDILWISGITGQRVVIKDTDLADLTEFHFMPTFIPDDVA